MWDEIYILLSSGKKYRGERERSENRTLPMELKNILEQFPDFQQWVENKKPGPASLSLLMEFSDTKTLQVILNWIGRHRPSHSQGIQILELAGELLLMGTPLDTLFETTTNLENLLKQLKLLRYPMASKQEEQKSKIIQSLSWPRQMKGRWIRQNDLSGLEIQFRCFSIKDLKQKIQGLEHIYNQLEKKGNNLWGS